MSKHMVAPGDVTGLLARFAELKRRAEERSWANFPIIVIQKAGLDGFWIHRVLRPRGSRATSWIRPRSPRRVGGGPRPIRSTARRGACAACLQAGRAACVRDAAGPTPEEEDRRRIARERKALTNGRTRHVNRLKGLLFAQGISGYEPLRRDRRERLEVLKTGDGRPLPVHLKRQIGREPRPARAVDRPDQRGRGRTRRHACC